MEKIFGSAEALIDCGFQAESPEEFWDWLLLACGRIQDLYSAGTYQYDKILCEKGS